MKTLKTVMLSVGAVALLGASGLYAQTRATADIPFEFTVANTTLPACEYTMSAVPAARDLMSIRNDQTGKQILVLASSAEKGYRGANEKNVVVFHQAGRPLFPVRGQDGRRMRPRPSVQGGARTRFGRRW